VLNEKLDKGITSRILVAIGVGILKIPEPCKRYSYRPIFHGHDRECRTIVTVIVKYQIHRSICNIEVDRIHDFLKKGGIRNLIMPLPPQAVNHLKNLS